MPREGHGEGSQGLRELTFAQPLERCKADGRALKGREGAMLNVLALLQGAACIVAGVPGACAPHYVSALALGYLLPPLTGLPRIFCHVLLKLLLRPFMLP